MPWRFIGIICVFLIFLVFIGINLGDEYRSNINFGFKILPDVPVFYTIFVSFVLGVLVTLPIVLWPKKKHNEPQLTEKKDNEPNKENPADITNEYGEPSSSKPSGKFFKKNKK